MTRTGDLPDEIGRDVGQRHLGGDFVKIGVVVRGMGVKGRLADLVVVDTAWVALAIFCYGACFCGSRLPKSGARVTLSSMQGLTNHPPP